MCFGPKRRALFRHLNFQKWSECEVFLTFSLTHVLLAKTSCTFSTSQLPKNGPNVVLLTFSLTSVLRTKTARAFSTSQLPKMVRTWGVFNFFNLFHLHMCFSPKRRALFRHLNFQKWSEREVLLAFSLANVLRASTACTFSSLIWPDGSAPTAFASLLFDPPEPQIIGKTQCFATFLPFRASASSFFWLFSSLIFSLLLFSSLSISAFHLSILSEVWLPNLLRLYMYMYNIYIYNMCVCVVCDCCGPLMSFLLKSARHIGPMTCLVCGKLCQRRWPR